MSQTTGTLNLGTQIQALKQQLPSAALALTNVQAHANIVDERIRGLRAILDLDATSPFSRNVTIPCQVFTLDFGNAASVWAYNKGTGNVSNVFGKSGYNANLVTGPGGIAVFASPYDTIDFTKCRIILDYIPGAEIRFNMYDDNAANRLQAYVNTTDGIVFEFRALTATHDVIAVYDGSASPGSNMTFLSPDGVKVGAAGKYCYLGTVSSKGVIAVGNGTYSGGFDTIGTTFFVDGATGAETVAGILIGVPGSTAIGGPVCTGTGRFDHKGDTMRMFSAMRTPANSAATGYDGEMCLDTNYVYFRTTVEWRRIAHAAF